MKSLAIVRPRSRLSPASFIIWMSLSAGMFLTHLTGYIELSLHLIIYNLDEFISGYVSYTFNRLHRTFATPDQFIQKVNFRLVFWCIMHINWPSTFLNNPLK